MLYIFPGRCSLSCLQVSPGGLCPPEGLLGAQYWLTSPSHLCRLSKERDCFASKVACVSLATGNRIIHVEVA